MNDLVSIVIPTYNRKKRLLNCIYSIVGQDYRPLELLIVNDGKKLDLEENYLKKVGTKNDLEIKIIENRINLGPCISRNVGITEATGEFITLCDDDDEFKPGRISSLLNTYKKSSCKGVFSDSINDFGKVQKITKLPDHVDLNKILFGNYVGAQFLTRKKYLDRLCFDRRFLASQDHDFITQFIVKYGTLEKCQLPTYVSNQYDSDLRVSNQVRLGRLQYYQKYRARMKFKHKAVFWIKFIYKLIKQ